MSVIKLQAFFLFLCISSVHAADGKKDVVTECSKFYKVLYENDITRVIQVKQGRGDICPMSFHANHFAIQREQMLSDKRDRHLVIARSVAINLLKELTPYSLANIGEILAGRDHTTIIHHISCKAQKNGLWFPYFEIWNSFEKLKLDLESDFKIVK